MIYPDHSPGFTYRHLDDSSDDFSYSPSATPFEADLTLPKHMSAGALHFQGNLFGAQPTSAYSYDELPMPPASQSDLSAYGWQAYNDATLAAAWGNQAHTQSLFAPHHRALSSSSAASHASDSPYSQPASLPYQGAYDNGHYYEPSYTNYQTSASFLKHNLPTPSHTPTQDGFDLTRRATSGPRKESGSAAQSAMRQAMNRQFSANPEDLPATPRTSVGDDVDEQMMSTSNGKNPILALNDLPVQHDSLLGAPAVSRQFPKLERPMPNYYSHEDMYPPVTATSAPTMQPHPGQNQMLSPYRNMVSERLQAANQARRTSDGIAHNASPFRQGSPFAASANDGHVATAAGARAQQKAEADAMAYHQHHAARDNGTPPTISPKDAVLDYHEPEDQPTTSLFPESSQENYSNVDIANNYHFNNNRRAPRQNFPPPSSSFSFVPPSIPASATPQGQSGNDLRFNFQQFGSSSHGSMQDQTPDFPAHLISMETSASEPEAPDTDMERPRQTTADSGTYTCTYHGCTQRFESPAKLQKHKREGHRSAAATSQIATPSDPAQDRNSQAGPHKCERINPSTGKPCNTIFSRPYDLTRHEDTIHNNNKKKVRCQYCTEEKTFSRSDALSRHLRVVHPEVDFPGKHRRRHID